MSPHAGGIVVRPERPADRARVEAVQTAAFGQADEARLVTALREAADPQVSLVADLAGAVVGHVFFSPVSIESSGSPPAGGLAPVGVDPVHQGKGVGSALIRAGLARCRDVGWKAVFLVGNPAYYGRFGFALAAPMGFTYGSEVFDPALQVIELEPDALAGCRGRARFHPAFEATGTG